MTRTLSTLRLIAFVGLWISAVAVVPAGAVPITVTTTVRSLLLDGAIGVTMGGYEYATGWPGVRDYTLTAPSTYRIQVSGDVPPPPPSVPEPATLVLVGAGLLGVTRRFRRRPS